MEVRMTSSGFGGSTNPWVPGQAHGSGFAKISVQAARVRCGAYSQVRAPRASRRRIITGTGQVFTA